MIIFPHKSKGQELHEYYEAEEQHLMCQDLFQQGKILEIGMFVQIDCIIKEFIYNMQNRFCAGNSRGFSESVREGGLPNVSHITFEGVFNELKFDAGQQTNKPSDLKFGYARYQFSQSAVDSNINDFLAMFMKGERDGKDRDDRLLNSIVCLDVSGSMDGPLSRMQEKQQKTRLQLSVQAMKMFVSKLRPNDAVGIVTFDTDAQTLLSVTLKKDITQGLYEELGKIKTRGGTNIKCGFEKSLQKMKKWLKEHGGEDCENRIIMITDVGDNSFLDQGPSIQNAAKEGVSLTIVGVSSQFQSHICEKLKDIRGFNYFCAINDDDIKKYIFQEFDFSFFPAAYNQEIAITCDNIESFEVFGVPDADKVAQYNHHFASPAEKLIVSKVKSSFPSSIEVHGDKVYLEGGLILLKLKQPVKNGKFTAVVTLSYDDLKGERHFQQYPIAYEFHKEQQFFSEPALLEAIEGFIFVNQIRALLKDSKVVQKEDLHAKYWAVLNELKHFAPASKLKDLTNLIQIVSKMKKELITEKDR